MRKSLSASDLKRAARQPWKKIQEKDTVTPPSVAVTSFTPVIGEWSSQDAEREGRIAATQP